jgi:pyruvate kinase
MRRSRKVKILATLGPASSDRPAIVSLFSGGADVFRINMSHASHAELRRLVQVIREVEAEVARPIGILADLQGPKLRIGAFGEHAVTLREGATFLLDADPKPGDASRCELPHPEIFAALSAGQRLLLDDGRIVLRVVEVARDRAVTRVEAGGRLADRKGVNVPDALLPMSAVTAKDRSDLDAALNAGVDWIAVSFVQRGADLAEVKKVAGGRAAVLAKIEKPQAVERLAEIVEQADALMVARGDLGVELPLERVPGIQKQITRAARRAGKPVVIATQMLESMIAAPVPTRAEVSDVATAVFEGADAIMLSAESAIGAHPLDAVMTMDRIAREVERDPNYVAILRAQRTDPEPTAADAVSAAARQIAETLNLAAVCCYTASGATALRVARERPQLPILALSPIVATARRLALVWGLHTIAGEEPSSLEGMVEHAAEVALTEGFATPGARVIIAAGVPLGTPGATNMLRIAYVNPPGGR